MVATWNIVVYKCSLFSSYLLISDSLNMSSINMVTRSNANAKETVGTLAVSDLSVGAARLLTRNPRPQRKGTVEEKMRL